MARRIQIAIDGPASSGKGTIARLVAAALGYTLVDTGALYRAVGLSVLEAGQDPRDAATATRVALALPVGFRWEEGRQQTWIGERDVTAAIRSEEAGLAASAVAVHPGVRGALLELQRKLAAGGGVVMDGRDIGTVILPQAELKIFLDASLDERARRRHRDLPGHTFEEVRVDLAARDHQDRSRAAAPLKQAEDAILIDTTGHTIEEVVAQVLALVAGRTS